MKTKLIAVLALPFLCALNSQLSTARAQSPFGNAVSLDGVNQYVSVPTAAGSAVNSPGWVPGSTPPSSLVTNTSDAGAGSLREAINTTPPGGFIYFAPNLSGQTITLTTGQLLVTNVLTIDASSLASPPIISGNNASRVLLVTNNAVLVLKSLTIANGLATRDLSLGIVTNLGGGIYNSTNCNLTLTRCLLSGNTAAALAAPYAGVGSSFGGGGIYNAGTLTLNQSTVSGNSARGDYLDAPTRQGAGWGGGIYNVGTLALHQSSIVTNQAYGGDVPQQTDSASGGSAAGGGIYNAGTLTLDESTLSGNSTLGGNSSNNRNTGRNGGLGGNGSGGGLYNASPATLSGCTLSGNWVSGGSGGSSASLAQNVGGIGGGASGGGIFNMSTITLKNCTLSGNTNNGGLGGWSDQSPGTGGDANGGGIGNVGPAALVNCTLSGNSVTGGPGGQFAHSQYPPAPSGASNGGGIYTTTTNATLHNSLIAQNTGGGSPDLSGSFTSLGYNLVGAINGSQGVIDGTNGDIAGTTAAPLNPMLSPLGNYGGPTLTMALQFGSLAMDTGDNSVTAILATDQRGTGYPRANFINVDIGAFEFGNGDSAPGITSLSTGSLLLNPTTQLGSLTVSASVNPNAIDAPATVWVQYGVSTAYGVTTMPIALSAGTTYVPLTQPLTNLAPGLTWHYRWVAVNYFGTTYSPDRTVTVGTPGGGVSGILGDADGNGVVSLSELDRVYANYVTNSPWLYMTNMAGLGGTNVTFSLSNSVLGAYSIQYSTNLVNWYYLGPATPRYLFTDTNAPALPQRYYRLRYP